MWDYNDGTGESNILQNQFTAYLVTAVRRKKKQYLQSKERQNHNELPLEQQSLAVIIFSSADIIAGLPLVDQIENIELQQALVKLDQRDLHILLAKALEGCTFVEIAAGLGLNYNTVATAYYRIIARIKKALGSDGA